MKFLTIFNTIISNKNIIGVMSSSIFIMFLGFYLGKKKHLKSSTSIPLGDIILTLAIPALSFNAFMKDFNKEIFVNGINILLWSFLIHLLLIALAELFYFNTPKDNREVLKMMTIFGGVTVFGIPIAQAIYGDVGVIYSSIFSIPYRILLYSYGFIKMSGLEFNKKNIKSMICNPVIIATFLGLNIWMFQKYLPQVSIDNNLYSIFRIDKTAIWLYTPLSYLARLCSPLAWLAAGLKLSEISIFESIKNKLSWQFSLVKGIILPLLLLYFIKFLNLFNILLVSKSGLGVIIIMMATPTASVIIAYSLKYNKSPIIASNCSFLSTFVSMITIPFLILLTL